jgi:hypothetical protein
MFFLLWNCAPILVSLLSFFVYVWLGNEVTVSVAFTAVALFGMIRYVIPDLSTPFEGL